MEHIVKINGREVSLSWTQEVAKRFAFRLATIGGMPKSKELTTPATAPAAIAKIVWALLPKADHARYESPEDLFVDIDQATEGLAIAEAVSAIFSDMAPDAEKKRSLTK
jgi:hypothetical protein